MADLYATLGVERGADAGAIKRAYRNLAKKYHPDQNKGDAAAAETFKRVTAAYDILSDAGKRAQYDRGEIDEDGNPKMGGFGGGFRGHPGGGFGGFGGDPSDLFSEIFGRAGGQGFRAPPPRGADVAYKMAVPLVDAALARPRRLTLSNGKTIDVNVPKGVEDGQQIRLRGQGNVGAGGAGDALITVVIQPDARFTRDGDNLRADIMVPLATAVLGGQQRVPTPEADVMLNLRPGSNSGTVMRLKGKGWTKKDGTRGDLLVRLLVDISTEPELAKYIAERQTP